MKESDAQIGMRVKFKGNIVIPPLTGTIVRVYPYQAAFRAMGELHPPIEAWAAIKPDVLPENWPYVDSDSFGPDLSELEPVQE